MASALITPSATEIFGVASTSTPSVPNFGDAVTFAAGFGGTVGVDEDDATADDVGSRVV